ncbi:MAG TPA: efflux RND transporter periplasmic adaptor subunit [Thiobacillus sp.]
MKKSFARTLYVGALLALTAGMLGIAYFAGQPQANAGIPAINHAHAQGPDRLDGLDATRRGKKLWVCPMHAHILQDHTGSCPICGMDLVEADADPGQGEGAGIAVDPALQQRLGVRLAAVAPHTLSRELHTYGTVTIDETTLVEVVPKIEGWLRKLHVHAVGQPIQAGQVLYEIYSPELVQRQREYIELLQRRDQLLENMVDMSGQNAQMAASMARERIRSREKFRYADVSDAILTEIERTRRTIDVVAVRAPTSGFVTRIGAREGAYVTPMVNLLTVADSARVWIDIALYPDQLAWIKEGDEATVTLPHSDQPPLTGRLTFASPLLEAATRTVRARLAVNNAHQGLRPGTWVDIRIATRPQHVLAIPRSAVIRTGKGDRVMLARDGGHFMPVAVEIGIENGDFVEIADGLAEGAEVAVNGQFLLDAAASMHDAAQRMQHER